MEIFLLLLDELDDAAASARALLPGVLTFVMACAAFALCIVAAVRWPNLALAVVFLAVFTAAVSALRFLYLPRLKTDP